MASVTGHWARSKNPICHTVARLYVVGVDDIPETPVLPETPPLPQPPADPPLAAAEPGGEFETTDPRETIGADDAEVAQQVAAMSASPQPKAAGNGSAAAKSKTASTRKTNNGNGSLEWRQPSSTITGPFPDPGMIRSVVEVPVRTHAYYEAARNDPDLGFDGTFSEFIDQCVEAFFQSIGYVGIRLVKSAPTQLEVG